MGFELIDKCPNCGGPVRRGSPYVDDDVLKDGLQPETWQCDVCGIGGGGANYWK